MSVGVVVQHLAAVVPHVPCDRQELLDDGDCPAESHLLALRLSLLLRAVVPFLDQLEPFGYPPQEEGIPTDRLLFREGREASIDCSPFGGTVGLPDSPGGDVFQDFPLKAGLSA